MYTEQTKKMNINKKDIINELKYWLNYDTPIERIFCNKNNLFIKKEEYIPFSFGGNKIRIAASYFIDLIENDYKAVVTYGSSSSNLCRVVANMAYRYGVECIIVSPEEDYKETPNSNMVDFLGAKIVKASLNNVSQTIDRIIHEKSKTKKTYFIYGGGYGTLGTQSYRNVLKQIVRYENKFNVQFDYIFITLATGTSMSGIMAENELSGFNKKIIGVSIAREKKRAEVLMNELLSDYDSSLYDSIYKDNYLITDEYRLNGYATFNNDVLSCIESEFKTNGMNLDSTYTGKAFWGMKDYLNKKGIVGKNILFIHTGGTPLFFKNNCNYLGRRG